MSIFDLLQVAEAFPSKRHSLISRETWESYFDFNPITIEETISYGI